MKSNAITFLAAGIFVLTGCSSVKTRVDTGPIAARTFSFLSTGPQTAPAYADSRTQVHALIQEAITKNLAAKGVASISAGGDITVAYLVIAGNNATTTSLNEYFGYTPDAVAMVDQVHSKQVIKGTNRGYFEAGTLVIDLINPKTSKVLKRASISAPILRTLPLDARKERVQGIVDKALGDLRIAG